jgi:hypothetical protein
MSTGTLIYRRNVTFNERIFPGQVMTVKPGTQGKNDNGCDLVGLDFMDDGVRYTITGTSEMMEPSH